MKIPRLLQAVLILVGIYAGFTVLFDVILDQVIPSSVLTMYMFFIGAGVFMVFTFTEEGARELIVPIKALVEDPAKKNIRNVVFVLFPLLAGSYAYDLMLPGLEPPVELRTIHPAPPLALKMFEKRFNLVKLKNPYRQYEKEDPERFKQLVAEGAAAYIRECYYCHGYKLDGKGPYAKGLNPYPLSFQDVGTIAQLQESFLFWRVATGAPGLPKNAAPWISSMAVWQNFMTEDEIWKVILFLYDYTGHRPMSWE